MTVGVLINPTARRNRKKGNRLEDVLTSRTDVIVERVDRFADLFDILDQFVRTDVNAIVISGGDGTVQAIQTHLAESLPPDRLPRLAILPDGTTNMNASDVGVQNPRSRVVLERITVPEYCARATAVRRRHTVRIDNPKDKSPQHGMFFGAGAIYRAVVMCHRDIHSRGLVGDWATGMTLLSALYRAFIRGEKKSDPDRIYQPTEMTVTADSEIFAEDGQLLALVTTLDRLILGSRPFWNQNSDAMKLTTIGFPPYHLLRSLRAIMYGGRTRRLNAESYRSTSASVIEIDCDLPFILDGEFIEKPDDGPLRLSLGPVFEFLTG